MRKAFNKLITNGQQGEKGINQNAYPHNAEQLCHQFAQRVVRGSADHFINIGHAVAPNQLPAKEYYGDHHKQAGSTGDGVNHFVSNGVAFQAEVFETVGYVAHQKEHAKKQKDFKYRTFYNAPVSIFKKAPELQPAQSFAKARADFWHAKLRNYRLLLFFGYQDPDNHCRI